MRKRKPKRLSLIQRKGLVTILNPESSVSEQYRMLRTNIQFSMVDKNLKTISCTSATASEGKSTTAANLAVTFAKQGQKVLLVDADLKRPVLHKMLGIDNNFGLAHAITKMAALDSILVPHPQVNNLTFLPAGVLPPNPSELLTSNMMKELISELSSYFDLILFDTPPVLAASDAQILSSICDGTLLVLRSRGVEKKQLAKAKELLEHANVNVIGAILNDVNPKEMAHVGYYQNDK